MKVKGIVALCLLAALAVVAVAVVVVARDGAEAGVKVDKGLAAYAGTNNLGAAQQNTGEAARSAASTGSGAEVSYDEQLGSPKAISAAPSGTGDSAALAPLEQTGPLGIVVQGYGRATASADTAVVTFVVSKSGDYPVPLGAERDIAVEDSAEGSGEGSAPSQPVPPDIYPTTVPPEPITEADLQPLIDAIKAQGVSDADIEVTIYPDSSYGYYGSSTARVTVTLHDMSKVGAVVDAGYQAVANSGTLYIQNVGVTYSVDNCDVLLAEARGAAVEDARDNGAGLADALGVGLGDVQGASEYSYDPYGYSGCQSDSEGVYYPYEGASYDPALPAEVQIVSQVTISFAMQ